MALAKSLIVASLIFTSGAAVGQNAAAVSALAVPSAPEKKICRSETPLGSIVSKRICRTRANWQATRARLEEDSDKFLDQRNRGSLPSEVRGL